ncbi:hypothetical protein [Celeribacter sp. SCSIO 80788]|uniref:hypothetical protein n=1 Tax=Celeribacter sp. SCSIO 80788 TaxID=3117013 RepID=UPI003DA512E1
MTFRPAQFLADLTAYAGRDASSGSPATNIASADLATRLIARCDDAEGANKKSALLDALTYFAKSEAEAEFYRSLKYLGGHLTASEIHDAITDLEVCADTYIGELFGELEYDS